MTGLNHVTRSMPYEDIKKKPESERWELLDGVPMLQHTPSWQHQFISRELMLAVSNHLSGSSCSVFAAPFDVILSESDEEDDAITLVQPDEKTVSQYHLNISNMMELIAVVQEQEALTNPFSPGFSLFLSTFFP